MPAEQVIIHMEGVLVDSANFEMAVFDQVNQDFGAAPLHQVHWDGKCLPVCLFVCLPVCLSVCLFVCLFACLLVCFLVKY